MVSLQKRITRLLDAGWALNERVADLCSTESIQLRFESNGKHTASIGLSLDGTVLLPGHWVLLKDQPVDSQNGLFTISQPDPTLDILLFTALQVHPGEVVLVRAGLSFSQKAFLFTNDHFFVDIDTLVSVPEPYKNAMRCTSNADIPVFQRFISSTSDEFATATCTPVFASDIIIRSNLNAGSVNVDGNTKTVGPISNIRPGKLDVTVFSKSPFKSPILHKTELTGITIDGNIFTNDLLCRAVGITESFSCVVTGYLRPLQVNSPLQLLLTATHQCTVYLSTDVNAPPRQILVANGMVEATAAVHFKDDGLYPLCIVFDASNDSLPPSMTLRWTQESSSPSSPSLIGSSHIATSGIADAFPSNAYWPQVFHKETSFDAPASFEADVTFTNGIRFATVEDSKDIILSRTGSDLTMTGADQVRPLSLAVKSDNARLSLGRNEEASLHIEDASLVHEVKSSTQSKQSPLHLFRLDHQDKMKVHSTGVDIEGDLLVSGSIRQTDFSIGKLTVAASPTSQDGTSSYRIETHGHPNSFEGGSHMASFVYGNPDPVYEVCSYGPNDIQINFNGNPLSKTTANGFSAAQLHKKDQCFSINSIIQGNVSKRLSIDLESGRMDFGSGKSLASKPFCFHGGIHVGKSEIDSVDAGISLHRDVIWSGGIAERDCGSVWNISNKDGVLWFTSSTFSPSTPSLSPLSIHPPTLDAPGSVKTCHLEVAKSVEIGEGLTLGGTLRANVDVITPRLVSTGEEDADVEGNGSIVTEGGLFVRKTVVAASDLRVLRDVRLGPDSCLRWMDEDAINGRVERIVLEAHHHVALGLDSSFGRSCVFVGLKDASENSAFEVSSEGNSVFAVDGAGNVIIKGKSSIVQMHGLSEEGLVLEPSSLAATTGISLRNLDGTVWSMRNGTKGNLTWCYGRLEEMCLTGTGNLVLPLGKVIACGASVDALETRKLTLGGTVLTDNVVKFGNDSLFASKVSSLEIRTPRLLGVNPGLEAHMGTDLGIGSSTEINKFNAGGIRLFHNDRVHLEIDEEGVNCLQGALRARCLSVLEDLTLGDGVRLFGATDAFRVALCGTEVCTISRSEASMRASQLINFSAGASFTASAGATLELSAPDLHLKGALTLEGDSFLTGNSVISGSVSEEVGDAIQHRRLRVDETKIYTGKKSLPSRSWIYLGTLDTMTSDFSNWLRLEVTELRGTHIVHLSWNQYGLLGMDVNGLSGGDLGHVYLYSNYKLNKLPLAGQTPPMEPVRFFLYVSVCTPQCHVVMTGNALPAKPNAKGYSFHGTGVEPHGLSEGHLVCTSRDKTEQTRDLTVSTLNAERDVNVQGQLHSKSIFAQELTAMRDHLSLRLLDGTEGLRICDDQVSIHKDFIPTQCSNLGTALLPFGAVYATSIDTSSDLTVKGTGVFDVGVKTSGAVECHTIQAGKIHCNAQLTVRQGVLIDADKCILPETQATTLKTLQLSVSGRTTLQDVTLTTFRAASDASPVLCLSNELAFQQVLSEARPFRIGHSSEAAFLACTTDLVFLPGNSPHPTLRVSSKAVHIGDQENPKSFCCIGDVSVSGSLSASKDVVFAGDLSLAGRLITPIDFSWNSGSTPLMRTALEDEGCGLVVETPTRFADNMKLDRDLSVSQTVRCGGTLMLEGSILSPKLSVSTASGVSLLEASETTGCIVPARLSVKGPARFEGNLSVKGLLTSKGLSVDESVQLGNANGNHTGMSFQISDMRMASFQYTSTESTLSHLKISNDSGRISLTSMGGKGTMVEEHTGNLIVDGDVRSKGGMVARGFHIGTSKNRSVVIASTKDADAYKLTLPKSLPPASDAILCCGTDGTLVFSTSHHAIQAKMRERLRIIEAQLAQVIVDVSSPKQPEAIPVREEPLVVETQTTDPSTSCPVPQPPSSAPRFQILKVGSSPFNTKTVDVRFDEPARAFPYCIVGNAVSHSTDAVAFLCTFHGLKVDGCQVTVCRLPGLQEGWTDVSLEVHFAVNDQVT